MKISDSVFLIDNTNANVYVIVNEGEVFQIDSGLKSSFNAIRKFYSENSLRPNYVLITHAHVDHIGALAEVYRYYKPKIFAHGLDLKVIRGEEKMPSRSFLMRLFGVFIKAEPVREADEIINKNFKNIEVIETPGHTPGSVSYLYNDGKERYLFVGDAAFERKGKLFVNRTFSLDLKTAEESLNKIIGLKPVTILPGHGNPVKLEQ